jgi:hypothetical protein
VNEERYGLKDGRNDGVLGVLATPRGGGLQSLLVDLAATPTVRLHHCLSACGCAITDCV